jgi:plasmid maintenance system antidote protein VapI
MLFWKVIAVCLEIHTKHISTLLEQKAELTNIKAGGV